MSGERPKLGSEEYDEIMLDLANALSKIVKRKGRRLRGLIRDFEKDRAADQKELLEKVKNGMIVLGIDS